MHRPSHTIVLAVTGASGIQYARCLLGHLLKNNCRVYLLFSKAAQIVSGLETDWQLPSRLNDIQQYLCTTYRVTDEQLTLLGEHQWTAPIASGSGAPDAMVVCPCTTGTLAKIAMGLSETLIDRAADVVIKEGRQLILMPREMPFSAIHLENMLKLARLGVHIMPPNPGFYHMPTDVQSLIDFVVARVLDQLGIAHDIVPPWGSARESRANRAT